MKEKVIYKVNIYTPGPFFALEEQAALNEKREREEKQEKSALFDRVLCDRIFPLHFHALRSFW